jgi:hypothetical protein
MVELDAELLDLEGCLQNGNAHFDALWFGIIFLHFSPD